MEKIYVNLYIVLILWDPFFLVYYKIKQFRAYNIVLHK